MVSRKEKLEMADFICHRLEDSSFYDILERSHENVRAKTKKHLTKKTNTFYIICHSFKRKTADYKKLIREIQRREEYPIDIFYKDSKNFFVRLADNEALRAEESLKRYTKKQINEIIRLRGLEKISFNANGRKELAYYQPQTQRLPNCIRTFGLSSVILDYSHIKSDDSRYDFVKNKESIDYKLVEESLRITEDTPAIFSQNKRGCINIKPAESLKKLYNHFEELLNNSSDDYESEERIALFLDSLKDHQLNYLTYKFGLEKMGGYALNKEHSPIKTIDHIVSRMQK